METVTPSPEPVLLHEIGTSGSWTEHILERWREAETSIPLSSGATLDPGSALLLAPADSNSRGLEPLESLAVNMHLRLDKSKKWIKRKDLLEEAAGWLLKNFAGRQNARLVCSAGYSELGDKSLEAMPHVAFGKRPLFVVAIKAENRNLLTLALRKGRTRKFFGIVVESDSGLSIGGRCELFLCDAFDGDSVVLVPVKNAT